MPRPATEWPTLALIAACYAVWMLATGFATDIGLWVAVPVAALCVTLQSSLQHEVIHGHPLARQWASDALVFPALGLVVPYERFRAIHRAHHASVDLTDPRVDPESNYLARASLARLPAPARWLLGVNNTLLGRMTLGPIIATIRLIAGDARAIASGDRAVARAWAMHILGLIPVMAWLVWVAQMPVWAYLLAAYLGNAVLKVRTFLEHQAHDHRLARSVIIEDRGPLALLFLNNNFHAVHHAYPRLAWYHLPRVYRQHREAFLKRNHDYRYQGYGAVFARYLVCRKDPVAHPLAGPTAGRDAPAA